MTVYSEGPFRQWTAVGWPGDFYVAQIQLTILVNVITIAPYPEGRTVSGADVFKGVVLGVDSLTQIDTTNVPTSTQSPAYTFASNTPDCNDGSIAHLYDEDGNALTVPPALGYNVQATGLLIASFPSAVYNAGGDFCEPAGDAPALPGFVLNERVTITPPT